MINRQYTKTYILLFLSFIVFLFSLALFFDLLQFVYCENRGIETQTSYRILSFINFFRSGYHHNLTFHDIWIALCYRGYKHTSLVFYVFFLPSTSVLMRLTYIVWIEKTISHSRLKSQASFENKESISREALGIETSPMHVNANINESNVADAKNSSERKHYKSGLLIMIQNIEERIADFRNKRSGKIILSVLYLIIMSALYLLGNISIGFAILFSFSLACLLQWLINKYIIHRRMGCYAILFFGTLLVFFLLMDIGFFQLL